MAKKKPRDPSYPDGTSDDDADVLKQAKTRWDSAFEREQDNIVEAYDDLRFIAGEQWDATIAQERAQDGRPMLTSNTLPKFIKQITGDMRMNNPSIKVRAVGDGADQEIAKLYTGLIRNIEAVSDARTAYVRGGESSARCGVGAWCVETCYADDDSFDQDIRIRYIANPLNVLFDPDAHEISREDGKWCFVVEDFTYDAFKERWPEARISSWDEARPLGLDTNWYANDTVRVAWYYVKKPVTKKIALLANGEVVDMAEDGAAAKDAVKVRVVDTHEVCQYVMTAGEVLETNDLAGKYIPVVPIIGEEINIGTRIVRHGAIRWAKDPQRMYNYHKTTAVETDALSPKAPFIATAKQLGGREAMWGMANRKNLPYLLYEPDSQAPGPPQRSSAATDISTSMALATSARDDLYDTIGIYPPSLGQKSNEQSGKAVIARQREADVGSYVYIDNLSKAIAHTGRILVDLIPKIYDTQRVVRILAEDDSESVVEVNKRDIATDRILNDLTVGKYDVVVETGPAFSTKRAEAAEAMQEFAALNPQGAQLVMDLIAKAQDWPDADKFEMRFKMGLPAGIDPEVDAIRQQMQANQPPPPPDPLVLIEQRRAMTEEIKAQNEARMLVLKEHEESRKDAETRAQIMLDQAEQQRKNMETTIAAERAAIEMRDLELTHRENMMKIHVDGVAKMPLGTGTGMPLDFLQQMAEALGGLAIAVERLNAPKRTIVQVDGRVYEAQRRPV